MNLYEKQPDLLVIFYVRSGLRFISVSYTQQRIHKKYLTVFSLKFPDVLELKLLMQRTQLGPNANLASLLTIVFRKVELA